MGTRKSNRTGDGGLSEGRPRRLMGYDRSGSTKRDSRGLCFLDWRKIPIALIDLPPSFQPAKDFPMLWMRSVRLPNSACVPGGEPCCWLDSCHASIRDAAEFPGRATAERCPRGRKRGDPVHRTLIRPRPAREPWVDYLREQDKGSPRSARASSKPCLELTCPQFSFT
jgi:hypothetical protein